MTGDCDIDSWMDGVFDKKIKNNNNSVKYSKVYDEEKKGGRGKLYFICIDRYHNHDRSSKR